MLTRIDVSNLKNNDLAIAEELRMSEHGMPGLAALRAAYKSKAPLKGARVTGRPHMTAETAALLDTLAELGAELGAEVTALRGTAAPSALTGARAHVEYAPGDRLALIATRQRRSRLRDALFVAVIAVATAIGATAVGAAIAGATAYVQ